MGSKLETAQQEKESAVTRATQLREQLDTTNAEFDKAKLTLTNTTKELKVRLHFIFLLVLRNRCSKSLNSIKPN